MLILKPWHPKDVSLKKKKEEEKKGKKKRKNKKKEETKKSTTFIKDFEETKNYTMKKKVSTFFLMLVKENCFE